LVAPARRASFGPDRRLSSSEDFERLMKSGRRRSAAGFVFFYAAREGGGARLGILISRRHAALASDRNRIKRCIREAFRQEHHRLPPMDLLVRPPLGLKPGRGTASQLRELLSRLEP
jgi:ribonuclease P protein component